MLRLILAALLIAASWSVPAQAVHRHHHRHHQIIRYDCSGPRGNMGCWIVRRASFMGGEAHHASGRFRVPHRSGESPAHQLSRRHGHHVASHERSHAQHVAQEARTEAPAVLEAQDEASAPAAPSALLPRPVRALAALVAFPAALVAKAAEIVTSCGSQIISAFRPGAVVAGTNRPSLHRYRKAVDIAGAPSCIYAHLKGWPGGYSVDYGRVRHVHLSYDPHGREWGARFVHGGGSHRYAHRHWRRFAFGLW